MNPELAAEVLTVRRLRATGDLAVRIAHDFNNLLTTVLGCTDLLLEDHGTGDDGRELTEIRRAGRRAAALARHLLTLSRPWSDPAECEVTQALGTVPRLIQDLLQPSVTLSYDVPDEPITLALNTDLFEQLVVALILNAQQSLPAGGRIHVRLLPSTQPPRGADFGPQSNLHYVALQVHDNGRGMTKEAMSRVFQNEPDGGGLSQSTRPGLAAVYGIVGERGGTLTIQSTPGYTTCTMYLPILTEAQPSVMARNAVLVVDDDPAVRRVAARTLERAGYSVLTAASVEAALALLDADSSPVGVVLADYDLGGASGLELLRGIERRDRPPSGVLMSGYGCTTEGYGDHSIVTKPFIPSDLVAAIASAFRHDVPATLTGAGAQSAPR